MLWLARKWYSLCPAFIVSQFNFNCLQENLIVWEMNPCCSHSLILYFLWQDPGCCLRKPFVVSKKILLFARNCFCLKENVIIENHLFLAGNFHWSVINTCSVKLLVDSKLPKHFWTKSYTLFLCNIRDLHL